MQIAARTSAAPQQRAAFRSGPAALCARPRVTYQLRRTLGTCRYGRKWSLNAEPKTAASFLIKADSSTVEKLQQAEKEFQALFESGKPQPTAKQVSAKRKEIKELREQLMSELGSTLGNDISQDMLASLGLGKPKLTAADKVRAVKGEGGVSMEAILELEQENRILRQQANDSLARLQLLEEFLQGLLESGGR